MWYLIKSSWQLICNNPIFSLYAKFFCSSFSNILLKLFVPSYSWFWFKYLKDLLLNSHSVTCSLVTFVIDLLQFVQAARHAFVTLMHVPAKSRFLFLSIRFYKESLGSRFIIDHRIVEPLISFTTRWQLFTVLLPLRPIKTQSFDSMEDEINAERGKMLFNLLTREASDLASAIWKTDTTIVFFMKFWFEICKN